MMLSNVHRAVHYSTIQLPKLEIACPVILTARAVIVAPVLVAHHVFLYPICSMGSALVTAQVLITEITFPPTNVTRLARLINLA